MKHLSYKVKYRVNNVIAECRIICYFSSQGQLPRWTLPYSSYKTRVMGLQWYLPQIEFEPKLPGQLLQFLWDYGKLLINNLEKIRNVTDTLSSKLSQGVRMAIPRCATIPIHRLYIQPTSKIVHVFLPVSINQNLYLPVCWSEKKLLEFREPRINFHATK